VNKKNDFFYSKVTNMTDFQVFIRVDPNPEFSHDLPLNALVIDVIAAAITEVSLQKYYSIRIGDVCYTNHQMPLSETDTSAEVIIEVYVDDDKYIKITNEYEDIDEENYKGDDTYYTGCPIRYLIRNRGSEAELLFILHRTEYNVFEDDLIGALVLQGYDDVVESYLLNSQPDDEIITCIFRFEFYTPRWLELLQKLIQRRTTTYKIPRIYEVYVVENEDYCIIKPDLENTKILMMAYDITPEEFDAAIQYSD